MNVRPLHPKLAHKAKEELHEDPHRNQESIQHIRNWISKQPYLKSRTDDQFLLTFLRSSKHSIERAKQKIISFYTLRTAVPELFKNRDLENSNIFDVLRLGTGLLLPNPLGEFGPRICLIRPGAYNPEKYTLYEIVKPGSLVGDIELIEDDNLIVSGLIEIIDLANVTMAHFLQADATFIKKISSIGGEASPLRHVGTHFINTPPGFETGFKILKRFISPSRRSRLYVHGNNLDSFYVHVPREYLPRDYGGENGSINDIVDYWQKKIKSYKKYFEEDEKYGVVEELRSKGNYYLENSFAMDGCFRYLNFD